MAISFTCDQCGRRVRAEDDHAGRRARCPNCGSVLTVPRTGVPRHDHAGGPAHEPEFRLTPLGDDEPAPPPRVVATEKAAGVAEAASKPRIEPKPHPRAAAETEPPRLAPESDDAPRFGAAAESIPEELLADRAPIPLDSDFAPPGGGRPRPQAAAEFKWLKHRAVRSLLKKLDRLGNWLYLASIFFLMVAIAGLLLDLRPLAHFGAVWVALTSVALAALGGIEVVVKPLQNGIFGTSWKTMKKQILQALGALLPLAVLIAAYFFIKPIRDYFLGTADARLQRRASAAPAPDRDRGGPPPIFASMSTSRFVCSRSVHPFSIDPINPMEAS